METAIKTRAGITPVLAELGIKELNSGSSTGTYWFHTRGPKIVSSSPADGEVIATVHSATETEYEACV
ncbi:MAG: aldehyde dehydrogenase family protein, partial [Flavobacteriales bacterium]